MRNEFHKFLFPKISQYFNLNKFFKLPNLIIFTSYLKSNFITLILKSLSFVIIFPMLAIINIIVYFKSIDNVVVLSPRER